MEQSNRTNRTNTFESVIKNDFSVEFQCQDELIERGNSIDGC